MLTHYDMKLLAGTAWFTVCDEATLERRKFRAIHCAGSASCNGTRLKILTVGVK